MGHDLWATGVLGDEPRTIGVRGIDTLIMDMIGDRRWAMVY